MKKSLVILTFLIAMVPAGTASAAHWEANTESSAEPTVVAGAAPRILELINGERAQAGLAGLALDEEVTEIAFRWSREMALAGRLSHNDAYLSSKSLDHLNATVAGENVAFADSLEEIHSLLMKSPPHRANILSPDFRLVGVGAVRSSAGELYLTEDFLTRRGDPAPKEEQSARAHPAKPATARRAKPPAPRRTRQSAAEAPRPATVKAPRAASGGASDPATKPPAPPAPPTSTAQAPRPPLSSPTPPPGDSVDQAPILSTPEAPSGAEVTRNISEPAALPVEGPTLEEFAGGRAATNSAGDLLKGLPALALFRLGWLRRQR